MKKNILHSLMLCTIFLLLVACSESSQQQTSSDSTENESVNINANSKVITLYNQSCISCHSSGAAGAPLAHDTQAWQSRLEKGIAELLINTKKGIGAMPPMGMCMQCTDADLKALIGYMSSEK